MGNWRHNRSRMSFEKIGLREFRSKKKILKKERRVICFTLYAEHETRIHASQKVNQAFIDSLGRFFLLVDACPLVFDPVHVGHAHNRHDFARSRVPV